MKKLLEVFTVFLKIGTFTIGTGFAMIPIIEKEVVDKRKWIDKDEFVDMIALGQSAPGPIAVDVAVFVGYKTAGILGSIAAVIGACFSSFLIIILIALYFAGVRNNIFVNKMFKSVNPAVVALIAVPALQMAKGIKINLKNVIVIVLTIILVAFFNVNPVYIILVSIILGLAYGSFKRRQDK